MPARTPTTRGTPSDLGEAWPLGAPLRKDTPQPGLRLPVPLQNSYTRFELVFLRVGQAARWYSMMAPLSTVRR